MNRWGQKQITKAEREEILRRYLENPSSGVELAMSFGLSQIYAYKLAHERGLLPLTRYVPVHITRESASAPIGQDAGEVA